MANIFWNLTSAFIGFVINIAWRKGKEFYSDKKVRWFWNPGKAQKIFIHTGRLERVLEDAGEIEPAINIYDAQALARLRLFLSKYFQDIVVTFDEQKIEWEFPVISLGGPIPNKLSQRIGVGGKVPLWFIGMPYTKDFERAIGDSNQSYKTEFDEKGNTKSDVGFVARIHPDAKADSFLYVIAGNYGFGTLGVVSYLTSPKTLGELCKQAGKQLCFEAIVRTKVANDNISSTEFTTLIKMS